VLECAQEDWGLFVGRKTADGVEDGVDEFVLGALNGSHVGLVAVVAVVENGVVDALLRVTGRVEGQAGNGRPPIPKGTQPEGRQHLEVWVGASTQCTRSLWKRGVRQKYSGRWESESTRVKELKFLIHPRRIRVVTSAGEAAWPSGKKAGVHAEQYLS
jgi:hypothetical protein